MAARKALPLLILPALLAVPLVGQERSEPVEKKTGYAPVNGLKMYYEISGKGKPAVYIHPIVSHCGLIPEMTRTGGGLPWTCRATDARPTSIVR